MDDLLRYLLTAPIRHHNTEIADLDDWWERHEDAHARFQTPFGTAVAGGFAADRVGYAFASGYSGALARLRPSLAGARAALCVTESAGNSPKHIETRLEQEDGGLRITGEKTFVTLGALAERLLIVAHEGEGDDGRKSLVVVDVPANRVGVTLHQHDKPTPFAPEIPHATLTLASVHVRPDERLEGDGYLTVVKPFRTIEDIHVNAALLGMFMRFGRAADWPHVTLERLLGHIVTLGALAVAPPLSPATHIALAGVQASVAGFVEHEVPALAESLPEHTREMLKRDTALLGVAGKARAKRRLTAWSSLPSLL